MSPINGLNTRYLCTAGRSTLATFLRVKQRPAPAPFLFVMPRVMSRALSFVFVFLCTLNGGAVTAAPAQATPAAPAAPAAPSASLPAALAGLPAADLARALNMVQQAATAVAPKGAQVQVQWGLADGRLKLAPCAQVQASLPAGVSAWGRSRVGLRCTSGAVAWHVFMPVQVQVWAPALLLRTAMPAGAVLADGDWLRGPTDWAAGPTPPLAEGSELLGRTLARPLGAGQAVLATDLRRRQWFASGEQVTVVSSGPGFSISSEGEALADGVEGQRVRVQLWLRGADGRSERGAIVSGRATGTRRVEMTL